jgi:hypothetical protein
MREMTMKITVALKIMMRLNLGTICHLMLTWSMKVKFMKVQRKVEEAPQ